MATRCQFFIRLRRPARLRSFHDGRRELDTDIQRANWEVDLLAE